LQHALFGENPGQKPELGIYKNQRIEKVVKRPFWAACAERWTKKCRQVLKIPTPDGTFD